MKFSPYIYEPDKSIEVFRKTEEYFTTNNFIKERIEELGWIYHTIGNIIPQTYDNYWSGHNFPYSESWDELQISFNLICFGLYKQAFTSLRSSLELGLLSVYYNINDDGHNAVKEWLHSRNTNEANTPYAKEIWNILLSNNNIKKFNDKNKLREIFNNLGYLHNYVHTKGIKYSNSMGIPKSNSQTFEPILLDQWLKSYADVISLVCTMHLLKYPISVVRFDYSKKFGIDIPNFGGLQEHGIDKISKILPENYLSDIEEIANEDPDTQIIITQISSLPDMTEEQIEEQMIHVDQMLIEHGNGFTKWLEIQEQLYKSSEIEFNETTKNRIEILREWATTNNFLESKSKRLGWDI